MAKKKKDKSKKTSKKTKDPVSNNGFWQLSFAVLMFVFAFLLFLGGFGTGGSLPVGSFKQVYAFFGWTAYLIPYALIFFAVHKFNSEDRRIPLIKLASMLGFLFSVSVALHTLFASKDELTGNFVGGHGGFFGEVIGNALLLAIDKIPASISMLVVAVLLLFLALDISLKKLLVLFAPFKRKKKEDTDISDLKKTGANRHKT